MATASMALRSAKGSAPNHGLNDILRSSSVFEYAIHFSPVNTLDCSFFDSLEPLPRLT
jgi:hypothetical protein